MLQWVADPTAVPNADQTVDALVALVHGRYPSAHIASVQQTSWRRAADRNVRTHI